MDNTQFKVLIAVILTSAGGIVLSIGGSLFVIGYTEDILATQIPQSIIVLGMMLLFMGTVAMWSARNAPHRLQ